MDVRAILLIVTLLCSCSASAQQVHKCVDGGQAVYQSAPCAKGAPVKTWDAVPEAPSPYRQQRLEGIQRELIQRRASQPQAYGYASQSGGVRGVSISKYKDPSRCEAAKASRASAFAAAGLHRSFELTRRMDDLVFDACK